MDVSFDDAQRIGLETRTLRVDPLSGCHWRTGDRPELEILFFHNVAREMAQTMTDDMKDPSASNLSTTMRYMHLSPLLNHAIRLLEQALSADNA